MAWYFLGKWIKEEHGYYPSNPRPGRDDLPNTAPTKRQQKRQDDQEPVDQTSPDWDPFHIVDGKVQFGDLDDLAEALGVDSHEDALELHEVVDDLDCHDSYEGEDGEEHCHSDDAIELDGNKNTIPDTLAEPSCKSDNDCSSPTCIGGGVSYTCVEGTCKCAVRDAPEPSEPEESEEPKPDIELVTKRPESGFDLAAWPGADCSNVKPWDRTLFSGRMEDTCRRSFVSNNHHTLNCVSGNVADEEGRICVYYSDDCTGSFIEIRRDDKQPVEMRWGDDGGGEARMVKSYTVKMGPC